MKWAQQIGVGVDTGPLVLVLKQQGLAESLDLLANGTRTEVWEKLPQVRGFVFDLMRRTEGMQLAHAMVLSVEPGAALQLPVLKDLPYEQYCLVLQAAPGSQIKFGELAIPQKPGDAWWIGKVEAQVLNNGASEWIGLIVWIKHQ